MRIALFGGTFDPPHRGHIAIARTAADTFALDRVLFAPTGIQPLKLEVEHTPFAVRLDLAAAACEEDPRFSVTDIDAPRADHLPNYTVDTLGKLTALHPSDTLFNLVGADSFLSLRCWRDPDRLLELAEWIVVSRPGYALGDEDLAPLKLASGQRDRIHILSGVEEDISATGLRERLRQGNPWDESLPPQVAALVQARKLYRLLDSWSE